MARSKKQGEQPRRASDSLRIESGALGPVPKCQLEIRPFTVLIGKQGTGKSLIAQVLYLFEELPWLIFLATFERGSGRQSDEKLFQWILDRLRSSDRAFATFANNNVHVSWKRASTDEWPSYAPATLSFRAFRAIRKVTINNAMKSFVHRFRREISKRERKEDILHHAIFFPTERMVISQIRSAMSDKILSLPTTYYLFSHWLEAHAAGEVGRWPNGRPDIEDGRLIDELGRSALGGEARKLGELWKWEYGNKEKFDLDMASSGQRANWSIPYIGRTLFSLRGTGDVATELTLFVEEPEIHLHPGAQREMVKILALLVNRGFRVVVTTHSMTVLYTLNNLLQASKLGPRDVEDVPGPKFRLDPAQVSVYAFEAGREPRQLVDQEKAFVDERDLGMVAEELSAELNRIGHYITETD